MRQEGIGICLHALGQDGVGVLVGIVLDAYAHRGEGRFVLCSFKGILSITICIVSDRLDPKLDEICTYSWRLLLH